MYVNMHIIIIIFISAETRPLLDINFPQGSLNRRVLRLLHPSHPRDPNQVVTHLVACYIEENLWWSLSKSIPREVENAALKINHDSDKLCATCWHGQ